jgi:DNA-binding transcriptional ArsR family regulator
MPRKPAETRHRSDPETSHDLIDALIAFHHPTRRWLCDILGVEGPASVGRLAARTGLAVGSVSHHLKPLYEQGFIEPAPELARDTRESWWRIRSRGITWSVDDFEAGTSARRVADQAEAETFRFQVRAQQQWLASAAEAPEEWRHAAGSLDTLTPATVEQLDDLQKRLTAVVDDWTDEVSADRSARPDAVRRSVRAVVRCFPSAPVRP